LEAPSRGISKNIVHPEEGMDDRKLLALAKKNAAKSQPKKPGVTPKYDATLPPEPEGVEDVKRFFKEMKRREF
jgi:hypothetical protein